MFSLFSPSYSSSIHLLLLFTASLSFRCFPLSQSIIVLCVKGSHLERAKGWGLFRDLLRLTIFFSPKSFLLPPNTHSLSLLSCILPLFHSSFCLHRGMNFNHSTLHLRSQSPTHFFPLSFPLWPLIPCFQRISSPAPRSPLTTPPLISLSKTLRNQGHRYSPLMTRGREYLSLQV